MIVWAAHWPITLTAISRGFDAEDFMGYVLSVTEPTASKH